VSGIAIDPISERKTNPEKPSVKTRSEKPVQIQKTRIQILRKIIQLV
jgi:hypothetical protein